MSCFRLDCECDYKEYERMIYHHGENYTLPNRPPASHFGVCEAVFKQAVEEEETGCPDRAFYHFIRCLSIIDKGHLRSQVSGANQLMKSCLDSIGRLRSGDLPRYHAKMMQLVKKREEERKRIVSLQLLSDDDDLNGGGNVTDSLEENHRRRQEALLKYENMAVDDLRRKMNNTHIPVPISPKFDGTAPYWQDRLKDYTQIPESHIAPPRQIPSSTPNSYVLWEFNTDSSNVSELSPRRGMVNLGNTCYLNSVTQVLSVTPLGLYFLCDDYTKDIVDAAKGQGRLVNSLSFVMRELRRTGCSSPVSPSPFKEAVGEISTVFSDFSQQDANEFIRILLDGIHDSLNDRHMVKDADQEIDNITSGDLIIAEQYWTQYTRRNNSVVVENCVFQERSSVTCSSCHQISRSFPPSLGIEVPIPPLMDLVSIEDCLRTYCKEEVLESDSMYFCPLCKTKVKATKQLLLYSLPKILFITIKRFRNYNDFSNKVTVPVFFQRQLDVSPFLCFAKENTIYNLVGIVNHQGNIHGGHYTADCLGADGMWFSFSDERVTEGKAPDYSRAYILSYVRDG